MDTSMNLDRTHDCIFITTHFRMGLGKMKQIKNVKIETDADEKKLRHQKQLMDSPELAEIASQDGKLKRYLESKTCRYSESTGFLPRVFLPEVDRAIVAYQTIRRPKLVKAFMEQYRAQEATDFSGLRESLGEFFHRGDYPSSDAVEAGFEFTFHYRPVGSVGLVGVSDVILAREIEKEESIRIQAVKEWRDAMRFAGAGAVNALFEALKPQADGKRKRLYDTTVDKLHEYLKDFEPRDLSNDTEWNQQFVTKLRSIMAGVTTEQLRESDNLKDAIATKLEELKNSLGTLVQVSGRKFR
jgi:hypothetical protein